MTWRERREVGGDGGESGREWMEKGAEGEEEADGMGEGGREGMGGVELPKGNSARSRHRRTKGLLAGKSATLRA